MTREHLEACRAFLGDVPAWVERECDIRTVESRDMAEREVVGLAEMRDTSEVRIAVTKAADEYDAAARRVVPITAPATDAARQWAGWGTALKPALEPITVARKPLAGTVAETVLAYGTGAINVDGCRVSGSLSYASGAFPERTNRPPRNGREEAGGRAWARSGDGVPMRTASGRWPANLVHDGGPDVADLLGEAARFFYCAKASRTDREAGCDGLPQRTAAETVERAEGSAGLDSPRAGAGRTSGARNHHPTVKPTDLMRYLCRLVTQPGGVVLDPFMGSGSTGRGAVLEGFAFMGIERDPEYLAIARARIAAAQEQAAAAPAQPTLFGYVAD